MNGVLRFNDFFNRMESRKGVIGAIFKGLHKPMPYDRIITIFIPLIVLFWLGMGVNWWFGSFVCFFVTLFVTLFNLWKYDLIDFIDFTMESAKIQHDYLKKKKMEGKKQ